MGGARRPVFVFGISGATWDVIDPLLAAGPAVDAAPPRRDGLALGARVRARAGRRPDRPQVAWSTLATGVAAERHGILRFFNTSDDLRAPAIWDLYGGLGLRVGLYGWPITWPPPRVEGFAIPSHFARDTRTWPPELGWVRELEDRSRLRERGESQGPRRARRPALELVRARIAPAELARVGATVGAALSTRDQELRALRMRHAKLELNAALFASLYRRTSPDFAALVTFLADFASHRYWLYRDASASVPDALRSAVDDAYVRCDRVLGRLLARLPPDAVVAVLSEHGMAAELEPAEVGEWRFVIRAERLRDLVGGDPRLVCRPIARWVSYRSPDGRPLPAGTAARFREVTAVGTGRPVFDAFEHGVDEVVVRLALDRAVLGAAPDGLEQLVVRCGDRTIEFGEVVRRLGRRRSAMHAREGVLVLAGPGVARARLLPESELVDVLPTLLRAAGLPRPAHLEGREIDVFGDDVSTSVHART